MEHSKNHRLISWIATLAILMGALAPSISQALSVYKSSQGFVVEICSTSGAKITQTISEEQDTQLPHSGAMQGHCPYCVVQAFYLLPTNTALEFRAPEQNCQPSAFSYQAPQPIFSWLSLPPRAPPALS
jgi:hypothetical protein